MKKVVITTGGTGGHIYPALAVAEELKSRNFDVLFVGSNRRMEKDLVPKSGHRFIGLDIEPPKLKKIFKYLRSIYSAYKLIKAEKPNIIIGFGNYISIPCLVAGKILGIKIYLQEQNVNIGFANKLFFRSAVNTFLAFDRTYDDIAIKYQHKFEVTGNPLRKEIYEIGYQDEREKLNVSENERILLITGGSLGAKEINDEIIKNWEKITSDDNLRIIWATGKENYKEVISRIKTKREKDMIEPYFDNLIHLMGASDLLICRAGALTISELIQLDRPSVIIPYSSIKVGQFENAKTLSEINASLVFDRTRVGEAVKAALDLIKNENELRRMRIRIRSLKRNNSAKTIVDKIDVVEEKP